MGRKVQQSTLTVHLARLPVLQVLKEKSPLFEIIAKQDSKKATGGNGVVAVGLDVAKVLLTMKIVEAVILINTVDLGLHKMMMFYNPMYNEFVHINCNDCLLKFCMKNTINNILAN